MKTVIVDVDTQLDFMYPAGALAAPGAEAIAGLIVELNRKAWERGLVVVSTMDAHAENDAEFRQWPAHCVKGTIGQKKIEGSMAKEHIVVPNGGTMPEVQGARQVVVEKQALDCFTNPHMGAVLKALGAERAVVYGVAAEYCVSCAAMGLLGAGLKVEIVEDAIQAIEAGAGRAAMEEFLARGGRVTRAAELLL